MQKQLMPEDFFWNLEKITEKPVNESFFSKAVGLAMQLY